jgi:hypothetical protein
MNQEMYTQPAQESEVNVYEAPAVIYEGLLTTRAGSPIPDPDGGLFGASSSDLFGE